MAWSPPAHERRIVWVLAPGDYATFNSNQTPDGTHPNPWRSLDCYRNESFEECRLDIERLYTWLIPSVAKIEILRQLSGLE
jgi:hypothetical protein